MVHIRFNVGVETQATEYVTVKRLFWSGWKQSLRELKHLDNPEVVVGTYSIGCEVQKSRV